MDVDFSPLFDNAVNKTVLGKAALRFTGCLWETTKRFFCLFKAGRKYLCVGR